MTLPLCDFLNHSENAYLIICGSITQSLKVCVLFHIYNYQCLLDLKDGCSLNDIKLYIPTKTYLDKREIVLRRFHNTYENYMEIEKRLISLRFERVKDIDMIEFYRTLSSHHEVCTSCNVDWYITLFDDGEIDGFVSGEDPRANMEYEQEMKKMKEYCSKMKSSKKIKWLS